MFHVESNGLRALCRTLRRLWQTDPIKLIVSKMKMKDFRGYNLDTYYTQYLVHSHGQTIKFKLHYLFLRYYQIDIDDIDIKAIQCRCRQIVVDKGNYLKRPIIKQVLVCLTKSIVAATLLYLRIRIVFHVCPALCTTHTVQTSTSKYFPRQER